jgi:hypothetical protein
MESKLIYTDMVNKAGNTVAPTMGTFQAAAANADFSKIKDFYLILTDQPGDKSWPITAATYMLLRKDSPADQNHLALKFLDWALTKGQAQAKALDYVPMPDDVVNRLKRTGSRNSATRGKWRRRIKSIAADAVAMPNWGQALTLSSLPWRRMKVRPLFCHPLRSQFGIGVGCKGAPLSSHRVDEDVAILIPHSPGCTVFALPVLHGRASLAAV